jgi:hypothetical protein
LNSYEFEDDWLGCVASIDQEVCTGDVASLRTVKKDDKVRDLIDVTIALLSDVTHDTWGMLAIGGIHVRVNRAVIHGDSTQTKISR